MIPVTLACALALLATPPGPAARDTPTTRRGWEASLGHAYASFSSADWSSWQTTTLALRRRANAGSVALEGIRSARFGATDWAGALDAYARLWSGAYGYWRGQLAPGAEALPRLDLQGELFQDFRGGWEVSAGARSINTGDEVVPIYSASVARFAGRWMLRARGSVVPHAGSTGGAGALLLRRYLGSTMEFVDAGLGAGREVVTVAAGPRVEVRATRSVALHAQKFVLGDLGLTAGVEYATFAGIPDRREVSLGVVARW